MELTNYRDVQSPDPDAMRTAGDIAARTHDLLGDELEVGRRTLELDRLAEDFIRDHGAEPAFYDFRDSSHTITVSRNDECIHSPPRPDERLSEGDVVSIDLGARYEGHYSDTARTWIVGEAREAKHEELVERTKSTLYAGVLRATAGNTLVDVGEAIEEKAGDFGNVTEWAGHFIGRKLHLGPQVFNAADLNEPFFLETGMYLAIEPILTLSPDPKTFERSPGGAVRTKSGAPAAHFEHTIRVGSDRAEILTARAEEPGYL